MKLLYIECSMGAAGDMLMSALYEPLEDKQGFLKTLNGLGLPGVQLTADTASSCGIRGTRMQVVINGQEESDEEHCTREGGHGHTHGHEHAHGTPGASPG